MMLTGEPRVKKSCNVVRTRSVFGICLVCVCVILASMQWSIRFGKDTSHTRSAAFANGTGTSNSSGRLLVIFWTTKFGRTWDPPDVFKLCSAETAQKCKFSNNRSLYSIGDVLLFHMRDSLQLPPKSSRRPARQKWVFYSQESPIHTFVNLHSIQGMFNLTMTYKRTSNVLHGYGGYVNSSRDRPTSSYDPRRNYAAGKTKMVVWFVSNCHTPSRRELYVRDLNHYIGVDTYGGCGPYRCNHRSRCHGNLLTNTYKFYLSFENSLCTDYVTEKAWQILKYPIVPVVLGRVNYKDILPPNSFIDVRDFASPKDLSTYLLMLHKNDTLYNAYFKWKSDFQLGRGKPIMCEACDYFHRNRDVKQTLDTEHFWGVKTNCVPPSQFYKGVQWAVNQTSVN